MPSSLSGNGLLSAIDAHQLIATKLTKLVADGEITPCHKYPDQEIDLIREWNALCDASPESIPPTGRGASGFSHLITTLAVAISRKAMDIVADMRDAGVDLDSKHAAEKLHQELASILEFGHLGHDDLFPIKTLRRPFKKKTDHLSVRFDDWHPTVYEKVGRFSWKPLAEANPHTPDTHEIRP